MNLTKTISTELNSLTQRLIKVLRFGKNDVQTALEVSPYGLDSNPIKDMVAIYSPTNDRGETVIIGYINKSQKAGVGEYRTFATDPTGTEKFYTWMKSDGTFEIGGTDNFAVKFNELKTEFNSLKSDFNTFLTHVHGGAGTPATPPQLPNTSNIDNAKNTKIKTI